MSRINLIQKKILTLGGGEFQKLADAYLVMEGFDNINAIGSLPGANKVRKGTPDSLVEHVGGGFIFAEHTTQQSGLLGKMLGDLEKCFDSGKTGIPIEQIDSIIFCFTASLSTDEQRELKDLCKKNDVQLELYGIDRLSFDLYLKYPGLVRDFLGISIDTGQIVDTTEFVRLYNNRLFRIMCG